MRCLPVAFRAELPFIFVTLIVFIGSVAPCGAAAAAGVELVVSVAASLKDVALELKPLFEAKHPDVTLLYNFGSSGALERQIERGAPVDVFLSAAEDPVARLAGRGLVAPESIRYVASNRLVLIAPARGRANAPAGWKSLAEAAVRSVAVGNPGHVPAGMYARQVLDFLGLWASLQPKLVTTEDVRQALHYVRIGAVDAGVVYATDAASAPEVRVVAEAPPGSHAPILYPAARIQTSRHPREADAFVEYLFTDEAREVFARHGFGAAG